MALADELPEGTFLWHWMRFCESLYPRIVKKNEAAFLITGMSLLTVAHRAYVLRSRPMPANFFISLIGRPASGKGRVIDCLKLAIQQSPSIEEIPTGSVEAIELGIEERKYGYLIWDEIGELVEKSAEYLRRIKYLINRMYYLDRITRYKVTKKSVDIPANSYYVNIVFAGLQEDWNEIENLFLGGFERRFIKVPMKRAVKPFEIQEPDREGWKHCFWIWDYLRNHQAEVWFIKIPDLTDLAELVMELEEEYWSAAEEYSYKIAAAMLINESRGTEGRINGVEVKQIRSDDAPFTPTDALCYQLDHNNPPAAVSFTKEIVKVSVIPSLNNRGLADRAVGRLLEKIDRLRKRIDFEGYITKRDFVMTVLEVTNSSNYRNVIEVLQEAGIIRVISGKPFGIDSELVILDTEKRLCANCKRVRFCLANQKKLNIHQAEVCQHFELG